MGFISDSDKRKLKKAAAATKKLNRFNDGLKAASVRDENPKWRELNKDADAAIRALPAHLRSRAVIERYQ